MTCNSDISQVASSGSTDHVSFDLPTASDAADDEVTVTCTPASDSLFSEGDTLVTCTAEDFTGNESECQFVVTVIPHPAGI